MGKKKRIIVNITIEGALIGSLTIADPLVQNQISDAIKSALIKAVQSVEDIELHEIAKERAAATMEGFKAMGKKDSEELSRRIAEKKQGD